MAEILKQYAPVHWENKCLTNTESLYHIARKNGREAKISVDFTDGIVKIQPGILTLRAPEGIKPVVDEKSGELGFGVFGIVVAQSKVLFINKKTRSGSFWYVPGGLVETSDKSLPEALKREVSEETGIKLSEFKNEIAYCYESITPTRHNVMAFYIIDDYDLHEQTPVVKDTQEIIEAVWMDPAEMYANIKTKKAASLPSIDIVFDHYARNWFSREDSEVVQQYEELKKLLLRGASEMDPKLMDLCVIRLINNIRGSVEMASITERAFDRAQSLLNE